MGRYTDKSRIWELSQTFGLFLALGVCSVLTYGLLTPLVILIAAYRVSYLSWVIKSLIVLGIHFVFMAGMFLWTSSKGIDFFSIIAFFSLGSAYVYTVFMSFFMREYLERLDLKNYMILESDVSYSYRAVKDSFLDLGSKEESDKQVFLTMLQEYRMKIKDPIMVDNLQQMEYLADLIVEKEVERSGLFFLKHSSALDSILKQYIELQDLPMVDPSIEQLKAKLHQVIQFSRVSFENELVGMFDVEVMSMASEADFYKNYVQSKGLI